MSVHRKLVVVVENFNFNLSNISLGEGERKTQSGLYLTFIPLLCLKKTILEGIMIKVG